MSGIGFTEMMLLAVVALIVVGPQRLPGIARKAGQLSRQARNAWQGLQSELQAELKTELQTERDVDHNRKIMQTSSAKTESEPSAEDKSTDQPAQSAVLTEPASAEKPDDRDPAS